MKQKLWKREEIPQEMTWNLQGLFVSDEDFYSTLKNAEEAVDELVKQFDGNVTTADDINRLLSAYEPILVSLNRLGTYAHLGVTTDIKNGVAQKLAAASVNRIAKMSESLSFIDEAISRCDQLEIEKAKQQKAHVHYLDDQLRFRPHRLSSEIEAMLQSWAPFLNSPFQVYSKAKFADLSYEPFEWEGESYPMSFVLYEGKYDTHQDTGLRRKAFQVFSAGLRRYNHSVATAYTAQIQKEKLIATQRGFSSVIDYLLFDQQVSREMYDRQIDLIMEKLAPAMRRYAKLLQAVHQLDQMTFPDLKMSLDYDFEPEVSIPEAQEYVRQALSVYGSDYMEMVNHAFSDRWIDYAQNIGKQSGAFCSSPYRVHPFILISWSERMRESFVLAHELGHAGHFYLSQKNQNIFDHRPSLYFIEAPSTMNELLMANYLKKQKADDVRFRRWVLSSMISRTYYHNFVTHLLEADFQRKVYQEIDRGGSLQASDLNTMKLETLRNFWGDAVTIDEDAGLTWMRQLHYYKGLYSYTYSAGLTIATEVNRKYQEEGQSVIEQWKKVLMSGGTKNPVGLAEMMGIDITTKQPLERTIDYISGMIDEMMVLTKELFPEIKLHM